jgi:hypothetical protein
MDINIRNRAHIQNVSMKDIPLWEKLHFIVNKMIYVTEVCSNQFIRYMIALQFPYMIALSLYSWSRDRWHFIDVQRSRFLELKVNNSYILSIRLISLKDCAVYFNIIICVYLRYFGRRQTVICEYLRDFLLKLAVYI